MFCLLVCSLAIEFIHQRPRRFLKRLVHRIGNIFQGYDSFGVFICGHPKLHVLGDPKLSYRLFDFLSKFHLMIYPFFDYKYTVSLTSQARSHPVYWLDRIP